MALKSAVGAEENAIDVGQAAAVWENATRDAERRSDGARADHTRLYWGLCLHRLGRCDDAVAVLLQTRDDSDRPGAVAAQILCLRLMGWCGRDDDAAALWRTMSDSTTPAVRESALSDLLGPRNHRLNEVDDRGHHEVCAYQRHHG